MNFANSRACFAGLLFGLLVAVPATGSAQQGAVAGRVTDQATGRPVAGAEVLLVGTARRTITNQEGMYRLENLPAGPVTVGVRMIGFTTATRGATVASGETAQLDFSLTQRAVTLDAVVVTATGERQRQRELGHSVATINASQIAAEAPVTNLSDLLNSRAAGTVVLPSGGTTGTGTRVRIRGSNSLSLSNEPIIIVDGARVGSDAGSFSVGVGGQQPSRLNDINPDDIESIAVVKGPAAVGLYGTGAASGVIQITTKRGRAGPTRWNFYAELGTLEDRTDWPANWQGISINPSTGAKSSCFLVNVAAGTCVQDSLRSYNPLETHSPFQVGTRRQSGLSASGGNAQTTYFVSGDVESQDGVYRVNELRKVNLRANFTSRVSDKLDFAVSTGYVTSDLRLPENDNNFLGVISMGLLGTADPNAPGVTGQPNLGFLNILPEHSFAIVTEQGVDRFTGSFTANARPAHWLEARLVAGVDLTNRFDTRTFPPGANPFSVTTLEGSRSANRIQIYNYTANFNATGSFRLSPRVSSATSLGVQYFRELFTGTFAFGRKLVAGSNSLRSVIVPSVDENSDEAITLGGFVQEQVALNDRLFVTGALRADDNSAFGKDFEVIVYPKLSASWVVSEEPFFRPPSWLSSLRLRAAWGRSGLQPGPTDAVFFYTAVAVSDAGQDVSGFTFGGLGNPILKPERVREWELGLDAGFVDERVTLELSYYDKLSSDALIERRLAPSLGVSTSRFENLGQISNKGVEISLSGEILRGGPVSWDVSANAWGNRNRVVTLGKDISPIVFGLGGASQRMVPGYPAGGYWGNPVLGYKDVNGDGLLATSEVVLAPASDQRYIGTPFPTHGGSFSTSATFRNRVKVYALLDGRFGHSMNYSTEFFRCTSPRFTCQEANDPNTPLDQQARAISARLGSRAEYIERADYVKLREVAVTFYAPEEWARQMRARGLSLTVSGRNLKTWTDFSGPDPEVNQSGQTNFSTAEFLTQPPVRYFTARVNINF